MKELAFRVWNKATGRFDYFDTPWIDWQGKKPVVTFKNFDHDGVSLIGYGDIQQFTGITDSGGRRVYEGDCVIKRGRVAVLVYDQTYGAFCFRALTMTYGLYGFCGKVIGNIEENPELLEGEKRA